MKGPTDERLEEIAECRDIILPHTPPGTKLNVDGRTLHLHELWTDIFRCVDELRYRRQESKPSSNPFYRGENWR